MSGEFYEIIFPDGTSKKGKLDENGYAKVFVKNKDDYKVIFPEFDGKIWEKG